VSILATTVKEFLQMIRRHCDECCGDDPPSKCTCTICNLYPYREGKDPKKRVLSEEARQALRERLAKKVS
jgi:hypothetical protein